MIVKIWRWITNRCTSCGISHKVISTECETHMNKLVAELTIDDEDWKNYFETGPYAK